GVMGKMIDAQSICVATAGTHQIGKEADIFKAVIWHSILLASIVGLLTAVQAYVYPFTRMVPGRFARSHNLPACGFVVAPFPYRSGAPRGAKLASWQCATSVPSEMEDSMLQRRDS